MTDAKPPVTTTDSGIAAASDEYSLTVGPAGPTVLHDHYVVQKMQHFNRERVPERVVHAKGTGAHGFFEVTEDVTWLTKASFLAQVGKRTPMFARFSTVAGEQGYPDTVRDPRGFALKFYTDEGNFDLVGNNTPVFFVRDASKFQDFIHSQKRLPDTGMRSNNMQWDFWTLSPESAHQVAILMSDRGTPRTWRHMNGYGSHTFLWYNAAGEKFWVKYHIKTDQGVENFNAADAGALMAVDADYHLRDLYHAIKGGDHPSWTVRVQVMPFEEAADYRFNPFDLTKVWPHSDYPPITIGKITLNRNAENYFAEIEQAAFEPANFVPGIGPSPDKMLQGRLFSYHDTHRHRLGPNYHMLPINAPKGDNITNYERDGEMRVDGGGGGGPNYWPNSFGGPEPRPDTALLPLDVSGLAARHVYPLGDIDFVQAGLLFRKVMTDADREHLISNITGHLSEAQKRIQLRQAALFYKADEEYGERVAKGLGLDAVEVKRLAGMSQEERVKATAK